MYWHNLAALLLRAARFASILGFQTQSCGKAAVTGRCDRPALAGAVVLPICRCLRLAGHRTLERAYVTAVLSAVLDAAPRAVATGSKAARAAVPQDLQRAARSCSGDAELV